MELDLLMHTTYLRNTRSKRTERVTNVDEIMKRKERKKEVKVDSYYVKRRTKIHSQLHSNKQTDKHVTNIG